MTLDQIKALAIEEGWPEEHIAFFNRASKPSVGIKIISGKLQPAASRFGGQPFVPANFIWPVHKTGRYRFLAQFNFDEILPASTLLPASGLLTLFFAQEDDGGDRSWDDGYVVAYYWHDVSHHVLAPTPDSVPVGPETAIALVPGLNIPRHRELRDDWPFEDAGDDGDVEDIVWELAKTVNTKHYLLGYPSYCTIGFDPTPGPDWLPLLVLGSEQELEWCWRDGDRLMVFIQALHLRCNDFSMLKCYAA